MAPVTMPISASTAPPPAEPECHIIDVPTFSLPKADLDPAAIVGDWLSKLESALSKPSGDVASKLAPLLHQDCWWRDFLAFSWDLRTLQGADKAVRYVGSGLGNVGGLHNVRARQKGQFVPAVKSPVEGVNWVESMFGWETDVGRGSGVVRLVYTGKTTNGVMNGDSAVNGQDKKGEWKAYMMHTILQELKGHEEKIGTRRPHGGNNSLEGGVGMGNWQERRDRQKEFLDNEPDVLLIGAGQAGLNMAARLQMLGLSCLIVDRNQRVGDNWRNRYRTLVTHDPVLYTHMAYLPFPPNWPQFTPKDKLGDWFEAYSSIMELNVWLSSTISSSTFDASSSTWTVDISRPNDQHRTLHPKHIVLCTGHSGEAKIPTFPGQSSFRGRIYHGSQHQDASLTPGGAQGKRVLVVGTGNSGHDIAQNYYEAGAASVTLVQRRGTYVLTAEKGLMMMHAGLYEEGPDASSTEDCDVYENSEPLPVQFALSRPLTAKIAEVEKPLLDGLRAHGFALDFGADGAGLYKKYLTRGGGYYIDVGCSELVAAGKIGVVRCEAGIEGFEPDALVLKDGRKVEADTVVLATGYDNMRTSARKILGDKVADRLKDVWDLDEEGELIAMWRPSGHPNFWYMGGNLALCRTYSKLLALQIKAQDLGLNKPY